MAINLSLFTAILPIVGVICGAALQFVFSRSSETHKHERSIRHQAYSDYLRTGAKLAHIQSPEDRTSLLQELTDAKMRIAIYGTSNVVNALAEFERAGASLANENQRTAFLHLITHMRERQKKVAVDSLSQIVLGGLRENTATSHKTST